MRRRARKLPKGREGTRRYKAVPVGAPGGVYLPGREQLVKLIAMRGASDEEIEAVYGLGQGTIAKWRKFYPGLDKAIEQGRTLADGEMLYAMFKNGIGYHYTEEQAVGGREPSVLKVKRFKPGEFNAQRHWLARRQKERWPATETVEHVGRPGSPIGVSLETRGELIEAIIGLIVPKSDPERKPKRDARV